MGQFYAHHYNYASILCIKLLFSLVSWKMAHAQKSSCLASYLSHSLLCLIWIWECIRSYPLSTLDVRPVPRSQAPLQASESPPLASFGYILHHTFSSGMTCWVQWVVLSLALSPPHTRVEILLSWSCLEEVGFVASDKDACGMESPATGVKFSGLTRFYLFRCICNLFYFCKT